MRSTDRRIFLGEIRMYFELALASIPLLLQRRAPLGVVSMGPEDPGHGELSELVPDHRRHDRGSAGPRLDDPLVSAAVHLEHPGHQVIVDEGPLLHGTWHGW